MDIHHVIELLQIFTMVIAAFAASSGFWLFVERRSNTSKQNKKLLMGLAHWKIINLGMSYIARGWVSRDEYENLTTYLYEPYKEMGGNGVTDRIMEEVDKLPITETKITNLKGKVPHDIEQQDL